MDDGTETGSVKPAAGSGRGTSMSRLASRVPPRSGTEVVLRPMISRPLKDQKHRYATIVKFIGIIERAKAKGDFKTAQGQYRSLRRSYSDIPFDRLVSLPVKVVTTPPGAVVRFNGVRAGKSPLLASYYPAAKTEVRVELPGFLPEKVTIVGDRVGLVRSTLAKKTDWTFRTKGAVERQPVEDSSGRIFLVDRSGIIYCIDGRTREEQWRFETKDLSGFLTRPQIYNNLLLVGSVDGPLRALDLATGTKKWDRKLLRCEASPVVCGQFLVLATTDRNLYALDLKKPDSELIKLVRKLPSPVRVDLVSVARTAIVTMESGKIMRIDTKGIVKWRATVGGGPTGSCLTPKAFVVATDEGVVTALDLADGEELWSQGGLGDLRQPPVVDYNSVFVVGSQRVTSLSLAKGTRTKVINIAETTSCAPVVTGRRLFVGCRSGRVLVLDTRKLRPLYLLRGRGACTSPVTFLRNGTALTCFATKQLQAYRRLP